MKRGLTSYFGPKVDALYISYNGLMEPLMSSQGIPYLAGLAESGLSIHMLSYEKVPKYDTLWRQEEARLREELRGKGLRWTSLRYHKRLKLLSSIYDMAQGIVVGAVLMARSRIRVVHARSYPPAVIALFLKKLFKAKFIFDMRGLLADEYADVGLIKPGEAIYKVGKYFEKKLLLEADAIVVLTERVKKEIEGLSFFKAMGRAPIYVVPCCVDLGRFIPAEPRAAKGLEKQFDDTFLLIYVGSVGTWYMVEEMFRFFITLKKIVPSAHFLILTGGDKEWVESLARENGLAAEDLTVMFVPPGEVPRLIAASTAGIAFIRQCYSKIASSPVKLGEYLACGIPAIVNSGVGDCEAMVRDGGVGVVVDKFDEASYQKSARELVELCKEPEALRVKCRALAEKRLSLKSGVQKYLDIYSELSRAAPSSKQQRRR